MESDTGQSSKKIRVAILDDNQSIIDGYLYRLNPAPEIEVVGVAYFGVELESLLAEHPADVVLLDVYVPVAPDNPNPYPILYAIPRLLQTYTDLAVLVISMITEGALIQAVMDAGAIGYVLKDDRTAVRQLDAIVRAVVNGDIYLSEKAQEQLRQRQAVRMAPTLTPQQRQALSLCLSYPGVATSELARKLGIAPSTVRSVLSNAYVRLEVTRREAAVAKARELGLITPYFQKSPH